MKNLLIISAVFSFFLISCDNNSVDSNDDKSFSCQINGKNWTSNYDYIALEAGPARKTLRIKGGNEKDTIEFILKYFVQDSITPNQYNFNGDNEFYAIYHHSGIADTAKSGYIKFDDIVEQSMPTANGSFEFEVQGFDDVIYNFKKGKFYFDNNE